MRAGRRMATMGIMPDPPGGRPVPVVLDVDTGVDDACALLLAAGHPDLDLRAVTCVSGNAPLPDVVRNTLTVLELAGATSVPVAAGAGRPLLARAGDARHVHGRDGMGDLGLPAPSLTPDPRQSVELLRDTVSAAADLGNPVTLVLLAPMTNAALFARTYPGTFARVDRIVFMGGAASAGNATPAAEFNVFHDPEACAVVLDACTEHGVPVAMYGLDVFYAPTVTADEAASLCGNGSVVGHLAGGLVDFACRRLGTSSATIGDAGALASVLLPDALQWRRLPVRVELTGTWTRGRTVVDLRHGHDNGPEPEVPCPAPGAPGPPPASVEVATGIDGPRIARSWLETVGRMR